MGDFDPRMDKWSEREFSSWGNDLKDAIFNKGRVQRERKAAKAQAERRARRKRTWYGRLIERIKFLISAVLFLTIFGGLAVVAFFVGRVMLAFFGVFEN